MNLLRREKKYGILELEIISYYPLQKPAAGEQDC